MRYTGQVLLFRLELNGDLRHGRLLADGPAQSPGDPAHQIELLDRDPLPDPAAASPTGQTLPLQNLLDGQIPGARLLCPVAPSKIVGVGSNYLHHTQEMGKPIPEEPILFLKPPSALLPHGGTILRPPGYARVDYEGELAVVVGRRLHRATPAEVPAALFGYTALNDVSVRDLQKKDGQFTRAKGFDTFCPLGPAISTQVARVLGPSFSLKTRKNGAQVQDAQGDRFLFSVVELVAFISQVMTLVPGDVITTGTPAGVGNLTPGDVIEIEIEGLPALRNLVAGAPARASYLTLEVTP